VGDYLSGQESGRSGSFILHSDGAAWHAVPNPGLPEYGSLFGIAAVSARDAWAVGSGGRRALIEHWDGQRWQRVASPLTGGRYSNLFAINAVSARNVWAVGGHVVGRSSPTLIEHWNGGNWRIVPSPSPPPRP
jgi:hypothetical protein